MGKENNNFRTMMAGRNRTSRSYFSIAGSSPEKKILHDGSRRSLFCQVSIFRLRPLQVLFPLAMVLMSNVHYLCAGMTPTPHPQTSATKQPPAHPRPRIPVLQYHSDWVCVNKPAGITVHKNRNTRKATLASSLKRQLARKAHPVHRLDHRTSGAILFAFNSETCSKLQKALSEGTKQYLALLRGEWRHDDTTVTVDQPVRVQGVEKEAVTKFTLLSSCSGVQGDHEGVLYDYSCCSLVLCEPETGRTHQIRRHARTHLSQPIIGDSEHGDSKINRWWRENRGLNRLALHCLSLDLPFESDGQERTVCVAPLPTDLSSALQHPDLSHVWNEAIEKDPRLTMEPIDQKSGSLGRYYTHRAAEGQTL